MNAKELGEKLLEKKKLKNIPVYIENQEISNVKHLITDIEVEYDRDYENFFCHDDAFDECTDCNHCFEGQPLYDKPLRIILKTDDGDYL